MSPESLTIIAIVSIVATVIIAAVALATFFHRMFSGMKQDLERQISGVKQDLQHETSRIWKRIDGLSDRIDQLSDKVNQIIGVIGAMGRGSSTGLAVEDSKESYKGDEGTTPAAKPKDGQPGGPQKSG